MVKSKTYILAGAVALLAFVLTAPAQAGGRYGHDKPPRFSSSEKHRRHHYSPRRGGHHKRYRDYDDYPRYRDHYYYEPRHYRPRHYYYGYDGYGFPEGLLLGGALGYFIGQDYD